MVKKTAVLNFIEANPKIKSGKYDILYQQRWKKWWKEVAEILNAIPQAAKKLEIMAKG